LIERLKGILAARQDETSASLAVINGEQLRRLVQTPSLCYLVGRAS
jgi:hypothetical protein